MYRACIEYILGEINRVVRTRLAGPRHGELPELSKRATLRAKSSFGEVAELAPISSDYLKIDSSNVDWAIATPRSFA